MSTPLPNEILSIIFRLIPDIASIKCATQTSRRFHELAEPALFRDVVFTGSDTFPSYSELARYELFCRKVSDQDGRLGGHVLSFQVGGSRGDHFTSVLPLFDNLRRLEICIPSYINRNHSGSTFPPTVHLTHLSWTCGISLTGSDDGRHLLAIINSQPSLEHLKLSYGFSMELFNQLRPDSLRSLRYLACFGNEIAVAILRRCQLSTLAINMGTVDVSPLTSQSVTSFSYYGIGLDRRSLDIENSFPNLTSFVFQSSTVLYLADVVFLVTNTKAPSLRYLGVEIKVDRKHSYHQFMKDLKKVVLTTPRDHLPNLRTLDILIEREDEYDDDEEEEDDDDDDEDKDEEEEKEDEQDESNRNLRKCVRICFMEGIPSIPIHFERESWVDHKWFDWWEVHQFGPIETDITFGRSSVYPGFL